VVGAWQGRGPSRCRAEELVGDSASGGATRRQAERLGVEWRRWSAWWKQPLTEANADMLGSGGMDGWVGGGRGRLWTATASWWMRKRGEK
jgi:hypothetical protein